MKPIIFLNLMLLSFLSTTLPAQVDLDRGLIAHYPFDSSGVNKSPNRLPHTDFTMQHASYNYGIEGIVRGSSAANFDGETFGRLSEGLQSNAFSVSLWFNTNFKENTGTLLAWDQKAYRLEILPGGKLHCNLSVTNNYFYDYIHETADLANGQWNHVVMSLDHDVFKIYIDGVLVDDKGKFKTDQPVHYATSSSLMIGNDSKAGKGRGFQGKIDELRLYNRSLNLAEVGILKASKPILPAFQIRFYETKGLENKSTFVAIHSSEAKKVSFTHKSTKKELAQIKMKPGEYVPLMQLKLGMGEFAYKVE